MRRTWRRRVLSQQLFVGSWSLGSCRPNFTVRARQCVASAGSARSGFVTPPVLCAPAAASEKDDAGDDGDAKDGNAEKGGAGDAGDAKVKNAEKDDAGDDKENEELLDTIASESDAPLDEEPEAGPAQQAEPQAVRTANGKRSKPPPEPETSSKEKKIHVVPDFLNERFELHIDGLPNRMKSIGTFEPPPAICTPTEVDQRGMDDPRASRALNLAVAIFLHPAVHGAFHNLPRTVLDEFRCPPLDELFVPRTQAFFLDANSSRRSCPGRHRNIFFFPINFIY